MSSTASGVDKAKAALRLKLSARQTNYSWESRNGGIPTIDFVWTKVVRQSTWRGALTSWHSNRNSQPNDAPKLVASFNQLKVPQQSLNHTSVTKQFDATRWNLTQLFPHVGAHPHPLTSLSALVVMMPPMIHDPWQFFRFWVFMQTFSFLSTTIVHCHWSFLSTTIVHCHWLMHSSMLIF